MKVAITGHTRGIGRACFLKYLPKAKGYSRTNGYDINSKEARSRIVQDIEDCDVFINNAYSEGQVDLLYDVFEAWKGKDKHIINLGSDSSNGIKREPYKYAVDKAALDKACEQLSFLKDPCKVSIVKFGYVGTDRILNTINPDKYIDVKDAVEYIDYVIQSKYHLDIIQVTP